MARCKALILTLLLTGTAEAGVLRATYPPFDWSFSPATRIPQYWLVDVPGDLIVGDVGDGDQAYVASTDQMVVRRNGAWVELLNSATTLPSGWVDDGTNVRLNSASDTVSIGTSTPTSGMKLTVSSHIGGSSDLGSNLGSSTVRFNDAWVNRVLAGATDTSGEAPLSSAISTGSAHLAMYSGASNQFIMPYLLTRRARTSLTSPSAVTAGDFIYLEDHTTYFGGAYTLTNRLIVDAESATSAVGSRWLWYTQNDSGSPTLTLRFGLTSNGNVVVGDQATTLATSATNGFLYGRNVAGQPTGSAQTYTGSVPQVYDSTNNSLYVYNSSWKQVGGNMLRVTADVSDSGGTFTNVTGLTWPVKASTTYSFECNLSYTTAATTTALQLSINGPASPTAMRYTVSTYTGATAVFGASENAYDTVTNPASGGGATALPVSISGTLENGGNAGTLAIRMRTEVSTSAVTVQRGSLCQVQQH